MAVKYTLPFKSHDNISWKIDIATEAYSGDAISIRGVSEQAAMLAYDVTETDDAFCNLVPSKLDINCYNSSGIDVNELQQANDKDFTVKVYRIDTLKWSGYLDVFNIQNSLKANPYPLTLAATDGLDLLDDLPYVHADLPGTTTSISRCPMNYIRQILFNNLGIILPIRWTNELRCTPFPDEDTFTQSVQWAVNGDGFNSYQEEDSGEVPTTETCGYILKGILACMQCRLYQANGMWIIRRIPEAINGNVTYKQIAGDLGIMTIQTATQNLFKHIGRSGYQFIMEDQIMTVKPGIKTCKATYNFNTRENILPNGSQDKRDAGGINPLYWGSYDPVNLLAISADSLDGRSGSSTTITNTNGVSTNYFTMIVPGGTLGDNGLPIDTKTLVKKISFEFLFNPLAGFPTTGTPDEIIDWSTNPFKIQVVLNVDAGKFYLNQYGFWVLNVPTEIPLIIDGLRIHDSVKVAFDKFQGVLMPDPDVQPVAGDVLNLQIIFIVLPSQQYGLDNISISVDSGSDVYESSFTGSKNTGTDERELDVSSTFGGYVLNNLMTLWANSSEECFYRDQSAYEGTLTGLTANAIMRWKYKSSRIYNGSMDVKNGDWSFDEIYTIDSLGASRFMPLNANYNIEKCVTSIVAIEGRNDFIELTEKYYNSNDKPLSN